jgi:YHS domain-containing protein
MTDINALDSRIDAEFSAVEQKVKEFRAEQVQEHKQRQKRMEMLGKVFKQMQGVWKPRLELLMKKFQGRVEATPRIVPSTREATLNFQSRVAKVRLKFSATTDRDVQKLILGYDLEIIPVLMRFNPHAELEFPLEAIDRDAAAKWVDDRIVEFVQTYFAMGENEIYLKDEMVEDPVAHVHFPKFAAATTLEWQGRTFYFVGEETRQEFEKQQGIAAGPAVACPPGPGREIPTDTDPGEPAERSKPRNGPARNKAAESIARASARIDEEIRHVDETIREADRKRQVVYPQVADPFGET